MVFIYWFMIIVRSIPFDFLDEECFFMEISLVQTFKQMVNPKLIQFSPTNFNSAWNALANRMLNASLIISRHKNNHYGLSTIDKYGRMIRHSEKKKLITKIHWKQNAYIFFIGPFHIESKKKRTKNINLKYHFVDRCLQWFFWLIAEQAPQIWYKINV